MGPQNCALNDAQTASADLLLTDFGLAQQLPDGEDWLAGVQESVAGTPEFLPPETADGFVGKAGDVWACGCVLFELHTGQNLFRECLKIIDILDADSPCGKKSVSDILKTACMKDVGRLTRRRGISTKMCVTFSMDPADLDKIIHNILQELTAGNISKNWRGACTPSADAIDLLKRTLATDPKVRSNASDCLMADFLRPIPIATSSASTGDLLVDQDSPLSPKRRVRSFPVS